jgi:predicted metalloprotease with PDZ domain
MGNPHPQASKESDFVRKGSPRRSPSQLIAEPGVRMSFCFSRLIIILSALLVMSGTSVAQTAGGPIQLESHPTVPAPVDHAFAGTIALDVDATDIAHRIFVVQERIPVQSAKAMTLLYPRWDAASHGPNLTVTNLAGLSVKAGNRTIAWRRDPVEPHAFHLDLPPDVRTLDVRFQIVAAGDLLTPDVVAVPWQQLILYPAGWYARNIPVAASVKLPDGLRPFTALDIAETTRSHTRFAATTMETLLDSPVLAGRYTAQFQLTPSGAGSVSLDVVASRPGDLSLPAARMDELHRLITQMRAVFGTTPFQRYDILAHLSDDALAGGTEHRTSSENTLASSHFRDWAGQLMSRDLIAHEIVHAWNGFYRRPADLWAATPNLPVSGSLLWMYEGQTEFWGRVLATRAGQLSPGELRDRLAIDAAEIAARPGRAWRPLSDDVNYPSFMLRQPVPWRDWQRRRDYYSEGVLLWLNVDAELRQLSGGRRNIDDFARRFFAGATPDAPTRTFTFDDICRALNDVAPRDWAQFLHGWIDAHAELDTTIGLQRQGWRLVFTDTPTEAFLQSEKESEVIDLTYSIGLAVAENGITRSVAWDGPSFRAGLRPGVKIVAIGGHPFSQAALIAAVREAARVPVVLTVEQDGRRTDRDIAYKGTLRYPRLQRIADRPDTLTMLAAPR